jgi:hypothetical protein
VRPLIEQKQRLLAGVTASMLLAGAAVALAGDDSGGVPSPERAAVALIAPDAPDLIAAFRRDQRADDRMQGDPQASLKRLGEAVPGEQPALARRLRFAEERSVHVWPHSGGVCYASDGSGGCFPTKLLRERGIVVGSTFSTETSVVRVFGIARDGIDSATFTLADGRHVSVAIRDNGFVADVPAPEALEWTNPDGSDGLEEQLVPASVRPPVSG